MTDPHGRHESPDTADDDPTPGRHETPDQQQEETPK